MPSAAGACHSAPDAKREGRAAHEAVYLCPGESHPISRSVHIARLAAFYQNCRSCAHRHDTGQLRRQVLERPNCRTGREVGASRLTPDGIRGVYLNEFARPDAERYAAAFASLIWQQFPFIARSEFDVSHGEARHAAPTVIMARDARASSPDLAVGAAAALQRMGCRVIDVGIVNAPCLSFAISHLGAAGGVYVTGHGLGPSATGLDFVDADAVPWSPAGSLDQLEQLARHGVSRPTRRSGSFTTFRADVPYTAGMLKHLQSLRPMQIGIACDAPLVQSILNDLFAGLPCGLRWLDIGFHPVSAAELPTALPAADVFREGQLHLAVQIAEDGQACTVFDERGRAIHPAVLAAAFAKCLVGMPRATVVVDEEIADSDAFRSAAAAGRVTAARGTREAITRAFNESHAAIGVDRHGRFWFPDQHVACDAILTLARLLRMLSDSGSPASALRGG